MAENTLCRNAALPYPVYGVPWAMALPLLDADGDPVTSAADLDAEIGKNGDTPADIGGTESEIGGGNYLLTFTAADMTANVVSGTLKTSTSGAKATQFLLQPRRLPVVASGTAQGGAAGYVTLAAGTVLFDGQFTGCLVVVNIDGTKQARIITGSTASNQQCTVGDEFTTVPDSDDTYEVMVPEGRSYQAANVTHVGGMAQTARDIGASVLLSSGTGTGQISLSSGKVTVGTNDDKAGYGLADDAITAAKYDESTAYPLKSADSGSTAVARTGADSDTLETLSDQIDGTSKPATPQTITAPADMALDSTVMKAAGYTAPPSVSAIRTEMDANSTKLANLDATITSRAAPGAAMTLTSGERTAVANEVEAQIIDDTDSERVLQAIVDKIAAANPSLDDLTLGGIASAVRTELTTELARIDAAISSRYAGTPPTAAAIRQEIDANSTKLDATVSSRLAANDYTAPPSAATNASTTAAAILATPANKLATDADGYVTSTNAGSGASAQDVSDLLDAKIPHPLTQSQIGGTGVYYVLALTSGGDVIAETGEAATALDADPTILKLDSMIQEKP